MTLHENTHTGLVRGLATIAFVAMAAYGGATQATALASASASGTLTIADITCSAGIDACAADELDVLLDENFVSFAEAFFTGSAFATVGGVTGPSVDPDIGDPPLALGIGSTIANASSADASADPNGLSDGLTLTDMFLVLENLSVDDTYTIDFVFDYEVSALASADDPTYEFAYAEALIELFDDTGDVDEFFEMFAATELGEAGGTDGGGFAFSIVLAPGEYNELGMYVDSDAGAAAVPEPGMLGALGLGLFALAAIRRRASGPAPA